MFFIYALIYTGAALMVFNISAFILFARSSQKSGNWGKDRFILYIPIVLLTFFLFGYLGIAIFGKPDATTAAILFGGSVFVSIVYYLLSKITRHIQEAEQLKAKLTALEDSNQVKTRFLSGVSHEMRTPLNVIIGLNTLSLRDESLSEETRDRIRKNQLSAEHILGIINNILDISSIENGEFIVKEDTFSMHDAILQVSAIAESQCSEKGLQFNCSFPPEAENIYLGDDMRIKQILLSLLDNAVKFTEAPGSVGFRVETDSAAKEPDTERFIFKITDTGTGIDSSFLPRLFDTFAREDMTNTTHQGGSGLGLSVTKRIVDRLGGTIEVNSEKGIGSVFTVTLTLKKPAQEDLDAENAISLEGRRFLIAEDIPENAEIVADLLELEGAESDHAENGKVALDMFTASEPGYYDAILMDLRMPVMDGIAATRAIRGSGKADADLPIIALSANALEIDVKESISAGMNDHLSKPADSDKLYATIKKHIWAVQNRKGAAAK
ncbi:MAG: response regulator [Clostridia bacterium]|nr:response regulator [Clostridia bacterium]